MVQTKVYNTQNHWVSGLCPSSVILNNYKTPFRQLGLFPSSGEGRETPTLLSSLERANRNHWTSPVERVFLRYCEQLVCTALYCQGASQKPTWYFLSERSHMKVLYSNHFCTILHFILEHTSQHWELYLYVYQGRVCMYVCKGWAKIPGPCTATSKIYCALKDR
jgi:hypothetical protein